MKKFLGIISICLTLILSIGLAGCGANEQTLSYSLEYNMNKLTEILSTTEEVETEQLVVPELYSFETVATKTSAKPVLNKKVANKTKTISNISNVKKIGPASLSIENEKKINYVPKRASSVNYENANYKSYMGKVEDLYIMVNDAVYANETIKECRENIFSYCQILNEIARKIKTKELEVSQEQIDSCNKLLKELGRSVNKITDTRNDVAKSCKTFAEKRSLDNGIDTVSSNYVTLLNCLDTRITDYENILTLLGQIQCILTDTCYNQNLNPADNSNAVEDLVEDYYKNNCFTNENGTYCPRTEESPTTYPFFKNETTENDQTVDSNENQTEILKNTPKTLEEPMIKENEEGNKENNGLKNIDTYSNTSTKNNSSVANNATQNNQSVNNQTTNNPVVSTPIQNGVVNNGIANNGIVGNGIIGNGYGYGIGAPIHNFENGVMNPYRNTDTYKLPSNPIGNGFNNGFGTRILNANNENLLEKPLPQERRKDFKTFNSLAETNANLENEKTKINSSTFSKYNETNKNPITKETLKNNLKKFVNQ